MFVFVGLALAYLLGDPQPEPSPIAWQAPGAECPSQADMDARVRDLVGTLPPAGMVVDVHLKDHVWHAEVSGQVQRTLEAASCAELADAVVLLARLFAPLAKSTIEDMPPIPDHAEGQRSSAGAQPIAVEAPEAPSAQVEAAERSVRSPQTTRRPNWGFAGAGSVTFLIVNGAAGGFDLFAGPRGRRWAIDLGFVGRPVFTSHQAHAHHIDAKFRTWLGLVSTCLVLGPTAISFPLCGGIEAGAVQARTFGLTNNARATSGWVAGRVDAGTRVPVHPRVFLFARATFLGLLVAPTFLVEPIGRVCCQDRIGLSASAGVEVRVGPRPAKVRKRRETARQTKNPAGGHGNQ